MTRPRVLVNALALHSIEDGARIFLENLVRELPGAWPDADIHVVASRSATLRSGEGVRITRVRTAGSGIMRVAADLLLLPAIADQLQPNVVLSPNESFPTRLRSPVLVVAQNLIYHCPAVGPLQSGSPLERLRSRLQSAFYRHQMPRAYVRADAVVAVSDHAARELAEHAGLDLARVHVVHCGADRLPLKERQPSTGPRRLLTVGAVAQYKRLDVAVQALARLRRDGGDYELILAGEEWPGYGRALETLAAEAGVATKVIRLGTVDAQRLAELFARAHAILSLSSCESFGLPIVEGMRAGVPAIVADEPWSEELVGGGAVRVDGAACDSVAAGVRTLESEKEWQRRADAGRRVASRYTWAANAAGIVAVARALTTRTARPAGRGEGTASGAPDRHD